MASNFIWDLSGLTDDKLSIEYRICGIDPKQPNASRQLTEYWLREERKAEERPKLMHTLLCSPEEELKINRILILLK